jgi:RNA polymerase sigma-70 factor (ECF subfamily)
MEIESSNCLDESSTLSEELIDARFTQDYINKLIEKLPEKCKLVFKFSRNAGLSISEISMELGISKKTVEGHLTKGLKALRLSLKNSLNLF